MIWGIPIVVYLFLAGMAAGAYATGALAHRAEDTPKKFQIANRLMVLVTVGIGLLCLMVDASGGWHHPLRFFYLVSNLSSVMAWGVIFLTLFVIIDLASIAVVLRRSKPSWGLDVFGIVASVCVALYTGVLLGVSEAFPLWNLATLPVLFFVSAASTGLAACLLVARCTGATLKMPLGDLRPLQIVLPLVEMVVVAVLLVFTASSGSVGAATVASLLCGAYAPVFWLCFVAIGLVVPCVLAVREKGGDTPKAGQKPDLKGESAQVEEGAGVVAAPQHSTLGAVESVCVLLGGFVLRYLVVVAALPLSLPVFGL